MLRGLLLVLLAANLLFFGFSRGWFDGVLGLQSNGDREPERLANQVRPASIVLMPMASAPPGTSGSCLESAPVAGAEAAAAEAALKGALPPGSWSDQRSESTVGTTTVVTHVYRVGNADAETAARLAGLRLDSSGRGFSACARLEPSR